MRPAVTYFAVYAVAVMRPGTCCRGQRRRQPEQHPSRRHPAGWRSRTTTAPAPRPSGLRHLRRNVKAQPPGSLLLPPGVGSPLATDVTSDNCTAFHLSRQGRPTVKGVPKMRWIARGAVAALAVGAIGVALAGAATATLGATKHVALAHHAAHTAPGKRPGLFSVTPDALPAKYTVVAKGPLALPANMQTHGFVLCPAKTVVYGGGVYSNSLSTAANINSSYPTMTAWMPTSTTPRPRRPRFRSSPCARSRTPPADRRRHSGPSPRQACRRARRRPARRGTRS